MTKKKIIPAKLEVVSWSEGDLEKEYAEFCKTWAEDGESAAIAFRERRNRFIHALPGGTLTLRVGDKTYIVDGQHLPLMAPAVRNDPPRAAEFLAWVLLPEKRREAMLGDLDERFAADCEKYGARRAQLRYWGRVLSSLRPLAWQAFKRLRAIALLEAARKFFIG